MMGTLSTNTGLPHAIYSISTVYTILFTLLDFALLPVLVLNMVQDINHKLRCRIV